MLNLYKNKSRKDRILIQVPETNQELISHLYLTTYYSFDQMQKIEN